MSEPAPKCQCSHNNQRNQVFSQRFRGISYDLVLIKEVSQFDGLIGCYSHVQTGLLFLRLALLALVPIAGVPAGGPKKDLLDPSGHGVQEIRTPHC